MNKEYRALIVYSSITGNTETIAEAFAEVFEQYNIRPRLVKLEGNYLGTQEHLEDLDSYDFLCIGTPVIASVPYQDLFVHFGPQDDGSRRSVAGSGSMAAGGALHRPDTNQLRIAFCTYGGVGEGPREAEASFKVIKGLFHGRGFVGYFACPGKVLYNDSAEKLGELLKIGKFRAQELVVRYHRDANSKYFADMPPEALSLLKAAAGEKAADSFAAPSMGDNDPLGIGKPGSRFWSYDLQSRPNDRDIFMAQAFLKDIIEDYCLTETGSTRKPGSAYYSIN